MKSKNWYKVSSNSHGSKFVRFVRYEQQKQIIIIIIAAYQRI